jgi:hypothetical protein
MIMAEQTAAIGRMGLSSKIQAILQSKAQVNILNPFKVRNAAAMGHCE